MQGRDNYLASLQEAYSLLVHWKQDPRNIVHLIGGANDGVAFTNIGNEDSGSNNNSNQSGRGWVERRHCYNCGEVSHISHDCTEE